MIELKELVKALTSRLKCTIETLPEALLAAALNQGEPLIIIDELAGKDHGEDILQTVYQYYFSDRAEKMQDFTPPSIGRLVAELTGDAETVYDLCAGSGSLSIQKRLTSPDAEFICEELDERAIPFLLCNMAIRNMRGWVINRNALTLATAAVYRLEKGATFSQIVSKIFAPEIIHADIAISNPPYNIRWESPPPLLADERFEEVMPPESNANWAFGLTALAGMKSGGKCALILPCGIMSESSERHIREWLVNRGLLRAVITLPPKMFESTDIPVCVLLLGGKDDGAVSMIDARKICTEEMRDQRGQFGGASHTERMYHKKINVLTDENIAQIIALLDNDERGKSRHATPEDIARNDFILTPARYVGAERVEDSHRPFTHIIDDINRIVAEKNAVKITCNETLARDLGLLELKNDLVASKQNMKGLDRIFKLFGRDAMPENWFATTKNKNELSIESNNKSGLSSLFSIIMPIWSQHLHYLNDEENRLLAELRDALLPKLMSGELKIDE